MKKFRILPRPDGVQRSGNLELACACNGTNSAWTGEDWIGSRLQSKLSP